MTPLSPAALQIKMIHGSSRVAGKIKSVISFPADKSPLARPEGASRELKSGAQLDGGKTENLTGKQRKNATSQSRPLRKAEGTEESGSGCAGYASRLAPGPEGRSCSPGGHGRRASCRTGCPGASRGSPSSRYGKQRVSDNRICDCATLVFKSDFQKEEKDKWHRV